MITFDYFQPKFVLLDTSKWVFRFSIFVQYCTNCTKRGSCPTRGCLCLSINCQLFSFRATFLTHRWRKKSSRLRFLLLFFSWTCNSQENYRRLGCRSITYSGQADKTQPINRQKMQMPPLTATSPVKFNFEVLQQAVMAPIENYSGTWNCVSKFLASPSRGW